MNPFVRHRATGVLNPKAALYNYWTRDIARAQSNCVQRIEEPLGAIERMGRMKGKREEADVEEESNSWRWLIIKLPNDFGEMR